MPSYLGVWSLVLVTPMTVQAQPLGHEALGSLGARGSPVGSNGCWQ